MIFAQGFFWNQSDSGFFGGLALKFLSHIIFKKSKIYLSSFFLSRHSFVHLIQKYQIFIATFYNTFSSFSKQVN